MDTEQQTNSTQWLSVNTPFTGFHFGKKGDRPLKKNKIKLFI